MSNRVELFECKKPCDNCPYRKDAPLKHWDISEFERLLDTEQMQFGAVYMCHKNNGGICVGWLMKQDEQNFPSLSLRIALIKHKITRVYLDGLSSPKGLYKSVKDMIKANYPRLLTRKN